MTESTIDILLVEDTPSDVALTMHTFKKYHLANSVHVVRDGAEALSFVFCTGTYAHRDIASLPKVILLDLKEADVGVVRNILDRYPRHQESKKDERQQQETV